MHYTGPVIRPPYEAGSVMLEVTVGCTHDSCTFCTYYKGHPFRPAPLEQAEHLKTYANLWRITDDFWDDWRALRAMFERAAAWCTHAGPGHWPDADMLPVGALRQCYANDGEGAPSGERSHNQWTHFTEAEQRTMMTLWCVMRSPLMVGAELTKNDDFTLRLLTNADILAIEKETWCAHPLYETEAECAWIAPRRDGKGCYVALFNLSDEPRRVALRPGALEMPAYGIPRSLVAYVNHMRVPRRILSPVAGFRANVLDPFLRRIGVISPVQESRPAVFEAHPHRQTAHREGKIEDAVHGGSRREPAGIDPHLLAHVLELSEICEILFVHRLLHDPNVARAGNIRGFHGIVDLHPGHILAADP